MGGEIENDTHLLQCPEYRSWSLKNMNDKIFFSAADRQLEPYLTLAKFEKSLYANVLFGEGIVIPEIFIFISKHIEDHILRKSQKSFLESAIEGGYVIPSFRDPQKVDFNDALYVVKGEGNPSAAMIGIQDNAELVAQRLQLCTKNNSYKFETWSTTINFGEEYERVMTNFLLRDKMITLTDGDAFNKQELIKLWDSTREWRIEVIGSAISETKNITGKGLRRGEIHNAVARKLKLPITKEVGDVRYLLSAVKGDRTLNELLRTFMEWVTECYHYNMSSCLGCIPNFPLFNSKNGLILASLLPERNQSPSSKLSYIEEEVNFPNVDTLRVIRGNELISIRNDYGHGFLAAKKTWQENPTSRNEENLRKVIREYSNELTTFIAEKYEISDTSLAKIIIGKGAPQDRKAVDEIFGIAKSTLSLITKSYSDPIISIGKSLFTVLGFWNKEPETYKVRIFTDKVETEISVPDKDT